MNGEIQTPQGPIIMRAPTESEAVSFEDKRRAARRPRTENEAAIGAVFDDGTEELVSCVVSPSRPTLEGDNGWLEIWPGLVDRMAGVFRQMGGFHLNPVRCEEAITEQLRATYGQRVVGYQYGVEKLVVRRVTRPEYAAYRSNERIDNMYQLLAAQGRACLVSPVGEDADRLLASLPYLSMDLGRMVIENAMGVAETKAGKSPSASSAKTATSSPQLNPSSSPATESAGDVT